jgi:hypothetical protein
MNAQDNARRQRIEAGKFTRAKELMAFAAVTKITIGWEKISGEEFTTFHPLTGIDPKFIEEATILSKYIKRLTELQRR